MGAVDEWSGLQQLVLAVEQLRLAAAFAHRDPLIFNRFNLKMRSKIFYSLMVDQFQAAFVAHRYSVVVEMMLAAEMGSCLALKPQRLLLLLRIRTVLSQQKMMLL